MLESLDTSWDNSLNDNKSVSKPLINDERRKRRVDNPKCNGCDNVIYDKYLISLNDTYWHKSCAMCSICQCLLDESCFMLEGAKLFCRSHYYKSEFSIRCAGCHLPMQTHEVCMRALDRMYHVTCFACVCCKQLLKRGDEFVLCDLEMKISPDFYKSNSRISPITQITDTTNKKRLGLVCRSDFESGALIQYIVKLQQQQQQQQQRTNQNNAVSSLPNQKRPYHNPLKTQSNQMMPYNYDEDEGELMENSNLNEHATNNSGQSDNDQNNEAMMYGENRKRFLSNNYNYFSNSSLHGNGNNNRFSMANSASKRPRTTLSFDQKRRLMVFFKSCQNPSYKQRESLSDEMKLPPKVIQVWFQNQRAKVRQIKKLSSQIAGGEISIDTHPSNDLSSIDDNNLMSMSGLDGQPDMNSQMLRDDRVCPGRPGNMAAYNRHHHANHHTKREHSSYSSNDNMESSTSVDLEYKFNLPNCDMDQHNNPGDSSPILNSHHKYRSRFNNELTCDSGRSGVILGPSNNTDIEDDDDDDRHCMGDDEGDDMRHIYMPQGSGSVDSKHTSGLYMRNGGVNNSNTNNSHDTNTRRNNNTNNNPDPDNSINPNANNGGFISALNWPDNTQEHLTNHSAYNPPNFPPQPHLPHSLHHFQHSTNTALDESKLMPTTPPSGHPFKFHG